MEAMYRKLKGALAPNGTMIFGTTTPVPPSYDSNKRVNADVLELNVRARALFGPAGKYPDVRLNDLYGRVVDGTFIAGELAKGDDRPYHVPDAFVNLGCASQLVTSLQVHTSNPATTMQEFIDNAKASGKTVTWGTSGAATMHATIGHVFFDAYGIPHKKVPFKGGSKARAALVSQSVEAVFGGVNTVVGFEDDIRPLASAGADRDPTAKDLATFGEQGLDGIDFTGLMCLFGPKGISEEVKADVGAAIEHIAGIKCFQKYMGKNSLAAFYTDSAAATNAQDSMYKVMGPVVAQIIASN